MEKRKKEIEEIVKKIEDVISLIEYAISKLRLDHAFEPYFTVPEEFYTVISMLSSIVEKLLS
ncbi:MAG: hypothetical protein Q6363_004250 [Candidatus Njordarchaeota archaeon]